MTHHTPVLLQEILDSVPLDAKYIVDGTLGHGGHTEDILHKLGSQANVIGIEIDENMMTTAQSNLKEINNLIIFNLGSYKDIDTIIHKNGLQGVDYILIDIGVNMEHFKDAKRGFSIKSDADLDMRFDIHQKTSAYTIINEYSLTKLHQIFVDYAEFSEPKAREISEDIVKTRKNTPIQTTFQLKKLLNNHGLGEKAVAVIFQSIRIEVNQELENLKIFLEKIPSILNPGGRCAIITFQSLEDRIVKNSFKELLQKGWNLYTKKAIKPTYQEVQKNKASRSSKLRIIIKPK